MTQVSSSSPRMGEIFSPLSMNYGDNKALMKTKADDNFVISSVSVFNPQTSLTEKQILSHDIVRQVLQKSRNKSVHHNVNKISPDTRLYRVPREPLINQFNFESIPPKNSDYRSSNSQTIKQIHNRLNCQKDLTSRLAELAQKNKESLSERKKRPSSAQQNVRRSLTNVRKYSEISNNGQQHREKRVSVSGLVSHNFNSVNARRSLSCIPKTNESDALMEKIQQNRRKSTSQAERRKKIIQRKPNPRSLLNIQISNAAVSDFHTQTDKFLKVLRKQSQKDSVVYGERKEKLNCVKQFMEKQKADYENSKFIVEEILKSQPQPEKVPKKKVSVNIDDEVELAKRKRPANRKRFMLKHLFFADI